MSDFRFMPVRGTDEQIQRAKVVEGAVHFAYDSKKIYFDHDGKHVPMGGNSGIYYASLELDENATTADFTLDNIDGNDMPSVNDLILNITDGCFFRVLQIKEGNIIHATKLTVAGNGSGGGFIDRPKQPLGVTLDPYYKQTSLINGQEASISFSATGLIDSFDVLVDPSVTIHWELRQITGSGASEVETTYWTGNDISVNLQLEGETGKGRGTGSGIINFGRYLMDDAVSCLVVYATSNNVSEPSYVKKLRLTTENLRLKYSAGFSPLIQRSPDNVILSCLTEGKMQRIIRFWFDDELVGEEILSGEVSEDTTAVVPTRLTTHGSHVCKIELFQAQQDENGEPIAGLSVTPLEFELAVVDPTSNMPFVWLGEYKKEYYNYDNISIPFAVYDPRNTIETTVYLKKNGVPILGSERLINLQAQNSTDSKTGGWNLFEITDAEINRINNYSIDFGLENEEPKMISFTVVQDPVRKMEYVKQANLKLLFDAKGRSNSESVANRGNWVNPKGNQVAIFNNFNWYNNGWVLDENKQTCLRISNGAEFKIPFGEMMFAGGTVASNEHSIEIQFKIRNIQDYSNLIKNTTRYQYKIDDNSDPITDEAAGWYDAFKAQNEYNNYDAFLQVYLPTWSKENELNITYDDLIFWKVQKDISLDKAVCRFLSDSTGICLGPQDAFFSNGTNTVNINYVENEMVHFTAVYNNSSKLLYIYINGVITGVIASTLKNSWGISEEDANIVFSSNFCDIDLYKIRIYNTSLNVNDVVTNHSVDKKDVLIYDQNNLAKNNENINEYQFNYKSMLQYNEEHPKEPLMPYIVFDTSKNTSDKLPFSKVEDIQVAVEFVNTALDAAYMSGELRKIVIEEGLCPSNPTKEELDAAIKIYYKHHCPSWKGDYCNLGVQGTSSEFYPRRNYKIKTKTDYHEKPEDVKGKLYHILLHKGPFAEDYKKDVSNLAAKTIKYGEESTRQKGWYMDNYTNSTDRWTMKVDYMESSGSYNAGFASMVGTAYSKHPLEDYVEKDAFYNEEAPDQQGDGARELLKSKVIGKMRWQDYRTSLLGFPVLAFHKKSENDYLFIGTYRMLLDKGSDQVLGFDLPDEILGKYVGDKKVSKKAECWEFCNNARGFCSYRDPWNRVELSFTPPPGTPDKEAYTSAGAPIIADNIEYRYHDKEDAIDAVVNLNNMNDEQLEALLKETGLTAFNPSLEEDKKVAREWLLGIYKNWEKVNKWVWSTNIDNVVSEGTYEAVDMYAVAYNTGTYYREIKTTDEETGNITITYEKEDISAVFNDGKPAIEWWTKPEDRVVYYVKREETDETGKVLSTTYSPIKTITQEVLDVQPQDETKKAYIYKTGDFYVELEGAYSISTDAFRDSETYYELIIGDYQSKADLLVKKLDKNKDAYVPGTPYYYYDGSVKITKMGDPGSLAVSAATDIVDEESYLNAFNGTRAVCVAQPVTYGKRTYTHDTKEYRADKFINELKDHFDIEYMATYFIMTEVFECYDSRGKNCMMASWGPLQPNGDYIWYPIFYDIDTQLGINNTGIPSFEYNVDATKEGNFSTSDSLLWNNFYKYFKNSHILNKYKHLRGVTSGVSWTKLDNPTLKNVDAIEKWYQFDPDTYKMIATKGVRPLIATNLDMWWKYITITNKAGLNNGTTGWLGRDGNYEQDNGTYFYALQGDRSQSRRQFLTSRLEYIDSWLNQGNYQRGGSNNIRGRVAANNPANTSDLWVNGDAPYWSDNAETIKNQKFDAEYWINLKPIRSSYVTVSDDAAAYPSQKYDGINPVKFEISAIKNGVMNSAGYPEQLLYIYGMNQMADLGEMHNLYWQEFDLTGNATHLTTLKLGTDELMEVPEGLKTINNSTSSLPIITVGDKQYYQWYNNRMNQPSIPANKENIYGGMPLLKEVNLSNIRVSTGSPVLDFSSCEKLQDFRAAGSNFVQFTFAEGVALHTLYLPNTITSLELVEANLLTKVLKTHTYPTRDKYGKLVAEKGLWIDGLFNTNQTSLNTLNLKGGNLKYGSYELLKQIYNIKKDSNLTTKVQLTNVQWSPYDQLSEGDVYKQSDAALYYKDNGHMRLVPYVYDEDTFDIDVLNGEIYKYNANMAADMAEANITDIEMFNQMVISNYWKGINAESTVPNITGTIYVNNTSPVNEFEFRNNLAKFYPNLKFFFAEVDEAYTAKFVIQESDGTYTYLTSKISGTQSIQTIEEGWFNSPYVEYDPKKNHYDFHGWSTVNNPDLADYIIKPGDWDTAKDKIFSAGKTTYIFYALFTKTKYEISFVNGSEVVKEYVTYGEPLYEPATVPYKDDSGLPLDQRYTFKGYSTSETSSKLVDLKQYSSLMPQTFYAVFAQESVYKNHTDHKYFTFTSYDYSEPTNVPGASSMYNKTGGCAIALNPAYKLKGKITLPKEDGQGRPVLKIADSGFISDNNITHIFWEKDCSVRAYGAKAFYNGNTTTFSYQYIEMPDSLRLIQDSALRRVQFTESMTTGKNVYYIEQHGFNGIFRDDATVTFEISGTVQNLGQFAIANFGDNVRTIRWGSQENPSKLSSIISPNKYAAFTMNEFASPCSLEIYVASANKTYFDQQIEKNLINLDNLTYSIVEV